MWQMLIYKDTPDKSCMSTRKWRISPVNICMSYTSIWRNASAIPARKSTSTTTLCVRNRPQCLRRAIAVAAWKKCTINLRWRAWECFCLNSKSVLKYPSYRWNEAVIPEYLRLPCRVVWNDAWCADFEDIQFFSWFVCCKDPLTRIRVIKRWWLCTSVQIIEICELTTGRNILNDSLPVPLRYVFRETGLCLIYVHNFHSNSVHDDVNLIPFCHRIKINWFQQKMPVNSTIEEEKNVEYQIFSVFPRKRQKSYRCRKLHSIHLIQPKSLGKIVYHSADNIDKLNIIIAKWGAKVLFKDAENHWYGFLFQKSTRIAKCSLHPPVCMMHEKPGRTNWVHLS